MRIFILISLLILVAAPISANNQNKNKNKNKNDVKSELSLTYQDKHVSITASIFSDNESIILNNYLMQSSHQGPTSKKQKKKKIPKGLQKKLAKGGSLPPGWQKKLNRGEVLDRTTYGYARPLPKEILMQLPSPPSGTVIVEIEGEIVRLVEATLTIVDILKH